jgi:hypothetical protein
MHQSGSALAVLVMALLTSVCVAAIPLEAHAQANDRFGPIPRFTWIDKGQPRPTPHIAETEVGIEPSPEHDETTRSGQKITVVNDPPSDCYDRSDGVACLRRNWLSILGSFGETELTAPAGERSYRFLEFPSFSPWVSIRLDVRADGSGVLTTSWVPFDPRHGPSKPARTSTEVSKSAAADAERAIAESAFGRLVGDPSALEDDHLCVDGADWVVEAYVMDRYRYVARHSCQKDEAEIRAISRILVALGRAATPDPRFDQGRPAIP